MTQANTSAAPEAGWLSESIPACLHRHSQTSAKAIATVDGEDSQSYEELDRESRRLARHLISSESDSKFVILFLKSGVDAALGIVGAMHSGHCSIAAATIQQLEATLTNFPTATIVLRSTSPQIPDGLSDSKRFTIDLAALPDLPSSDQELPEVSSRTTPAQVILTSGSTGESKAVLYPQCAI